MECQIKFKGCQGTAIQKHHISYFPEETIAACDSCHKAIHSKKHPELAKYLKYTPGDAKLFYSQNDRIASFLDNIYHGHRKSKMLSKLSYVIPKFVKFMPEEKQEGILYISLEYGTAIHRCACGCGELTVTPLNEDNWSIDIKDNKVTLKPSIGNFRMPCKSHYWITENKIVWC